MRRASHAKGDAVRIAACAVWLLAATSVGCTSWETKPTGPPTGGRIARVVTLMSPYAVNWDGDPEYDGLSLFVLFFAVGRDEPIAVDGTVTFLLYAGSKPQPKAKPIHKWTYTPEQVKGHLGKSPYGWGYGFRLDWGDDVPKSAAVSLIAEIRTKEGQVQRSREAVVRMGVRS